MEVFHETAVNFKNLMFNDLKYTISDELWSDIMKKYPHTDRFLEDFQPGVEYIIFVFFKYRFLIPDQLEITGEPCQQTEDSSSVTESSMSEYVESEWNFYVLFSTLINGYIKIFPLFPSINEYYIGLWN